MATLKLIPASGAPIEVTRDTLTVGRDPSCDVVLVDGSVSRKHARVERRGETWAVVDQGSANGTFINSQRVSDSVLRHGQELRFGALAYRVESSDNAETPATVPGGEVGATVVSPPPRPSAPPPPAAARPAPPPPPPPPPPASSPKPVGSALPPARPSRPAQPASRPVARPTGDERKGKGPLFWITAGCCGCLLLLALGAGGFFGFIYYSTKGAADVVREQLVSVKAGNIDAAYQLLTEEYRARLSRSDFEALLNQHAALKDNADASFWNRKISNGEATLNGTVTATTGEKEAVIFRLIKENDQWRIKDIAFGEESSCWPVPTPHEERLASHRTARHLM